VASGNARVQQYVGAGCADSTDMKTFYALPRGSCVRQWTTAAHDAQAGRQRAEEQRAQQRSGTFIDGALAQPRRAEH
jgi:hydroxyethylthiazole kinase-like sugar kinase family protein